MVTEYDIFVALRAFIMGAVPGIDVVRGLVNRVPEPQADNFIVITPIMRERLEWNTDSYADVETLALTTLTAPVPWLNNAAAPIPWLNNAAGCPIGTVLHDSTLAASGAVLSVSGMNVTLGSIGGRYFTAGDVIAGVGTVVDVAFGGRSIMQPTKLTLQMDAHGPLSADNAQLLTTLLRDQYAVDALAPTCAPLYASDPSQLPFINGEDQVEERWSVDAVLQANIVVVVPVQFAGALTIGLIDVDAVYPA